MNETKTTFLSIFLPLVLAVNTHAESAELQCKPSISRMHYKADWRHSNNNKSTTWPSFCKWLGICYYVLFKFKQVRENPQQVPVSTPFAFLLTAVLLIFLPGLIETGSVTMFGSDPGKVGLLGQQAEDTGLITSTSNIDVNVILQEMQSSRTHCLAWHV